MFFNACFGASVLTSSIYTRNAQTFYINGVAYGSYEQKIYMNGISKGRYYVKIKGYEFWATSTPAFTVSGISGATATIEELYMANNANVYCTIPLLRNEINHPMNLDLGIQNLTGYLTLRIILQAPNMGLNNMNFSLYLEIDEVKDDPTEVKTSTD